MSISKKDTHELSITNGGDLKPFLINFVDNDHIIFVVEKCQRLASAIYVITSPLSDSDPLRDRLRTCAVGLISSTATGSILNEPFKSACVEIGTMIKLGEQAGLISPMNAAVMVSEYTNLAGFVRENYETLMSLKDRVKETIGTQDEPSIRHAHIKNESKTKVNYKRHSNRRSIILGLFSTKDRITINDLTEVINDCSEKTIQRELNALVNERVLTREGERRWSAYRKAVPLG